MNLQRTFDILDFQLDRYPQKQAIVSLQNGEWKSYSTQACLEQVDIYRRVLYGLGLRKGDFLIVVPELATAEWLFMDLAAQKSGIVMVPVHITAQASHFAHILQETQARICFLPDREWETTHLDDWSLGQSERFYFEGTSQEEDSLAYLLQEVPAVDQETLQEISESIISQDLAVIMYTSGTTGIPKGVMLSHFNIVSNIGCLLPLLPIKPGTRALSFLPVSHIFERTVLQTYITVGMSVYLVGDKDKVRDALKTAQPAFFTSVPRILEKMYAEVLTFRAKQKFPKKQIISWGLKVAENYREQGGFRPGNWISRQIAKWIVFKRFRDNLGGKVEGIFVGAAHLQPSIGRMFEGAGIMVREGYGMTEASPAITANRFTPGLNRFGTVGLPIPGVKVKIHDADEEGVGEILVQGPNVMMGYYKQAEETDKVLTPDAWLHTGDIGKFVKNRFLQITDRKKDIFKTSSGKYIAPLELESHFSQSPYIDQLMIVGFKKPFITALIKPSFDLLQLWCEEHGVHWTSPQYMVVNIKVRQKIQEEIEALNAKLPHFKTIRDFHLMFEEWEVQNGQLSGTLKPIRPNILGDYAKDIEKMYKG